MELKFGTGGIPLTSRSSSTLDGIRRISELGLGSLELEFVHQVYLNEETAKEVGDFAKTKKIDLSIHGSYYVNLASEDKQKWNASIERIEKAAKIGSIAGARYLTFHSGFRQGRAESQVYDSIKSGILEILDYLEKENLNIKITPELTGKASQWGDMEELIKLNKEINHKKLGFCFDFAHKHARDGGGYNSTEDFDHMLKLIGDELGQDFLADMHIHISGINYSTKGERNHLTLLGEASKYDEMGLEVEGISKFYEIMEQKGKIGPADLEYRALLKSLKAHNVGGVVVCESPNLEQDALLMQKVYNQF